MSRYSAFLTRRNRAPRKETQEAAAPHPMHAQQTSFQILFGSAFQIGTSLGGERENPAGWISRPRGKGALHGVRDGMSLSAAVRRPQEGSGMIRVGDGGGQWLSPSAAIVQREERAHTSDGPGSHDPFNAMETG